VAAQVRRHTWRAVSPSLPAVPGGWKTFGGCATDSPGMQAAMGFSLGDVLGDPSLANRTFALGTQGVLVATAPPRARTTYRFAIAFYRGGRATSGLDASYFYTRFYDSLEAVAEYALSHHAELRAAALRADDTLRASALSADQQFSLAHAVRAYYGSTQLLQVGGKPLWVVNEGEYRMMNTFDLTVDQLFFELRMNPWTVRNVLDFFTHRYSYTDTVTFPPGEGGALGDGPHPGGLSFTHDMGVANAFSQPGRGAYEQAGLRGLFSFMTHEQLVNWVLCAAAYAHATGDNPWLRANEDTLVRALASLQARDHPDAAKRDGIMSLDSTRTAGGAEITTYDSLDTSLGRARGNVYLGGKTWAAYVALEHVFFSRGREADAAAARAGADAAARTLTAAYVAAGPGGHMPAVLGVGGTNSAIIPAVEGLAFPAACGAAGALDPNGRYKEYLAALRGHLKAVLQPGVCLFRDGGWKLSSTSDNSWLSKVYLAQHVARTHLGLPGDDAAARAADAAHASWLLHATETRAGGRGATKTSTACPTPAGTTHAASPPSSGSTRLCDVRAGRRELIAVSPPRCRGRGLHRLYCRALPPLRLRAATWCAGSEKHCKYNRFSGLAHTGATKEHSGAQLLACAAPCVLCSRVQSGQRTRVLARGRLAAWPQHAAPTAQIYTRGAAR